jgi:hypothetical protein
MSLARHDPDAYFESQGGWPDDWTELDELYYREWSTTVEEQTPPSEPDDLGEPCGAWFEDEAPTTDDKDTRPIRPRPGPRSAA